MPDLKTVGQNAIFMGAASAGIAYFTNYGVKAVVDAINGSKIAYIAKASYPPLLSYPVCAGIGALFAVIDAIMVKILKELSDDCSKPTTVFLRVVVSIILTSLITSATGMMSLQATHLFLAITLLAYKFAIQTIVELNKILYPTRPISFRD